MPEPIIYIDRSEVRRGSLEPLKQALRELADFVERNEPELLAYLAYFNESGSEVSVVHIHRDSRSLELHGEVAGPLFPRFADHVNLLSIDVYGEPSEAALAQLQRKAAMLGSGGVTVHALHAGFARFDPRPQLESPPETIGADG